MTHHHSHHLKSSLTPEGRKRVQFILKRRETGPYGTWSYDPGYSIGSSSSLSSGLRNSVLFIGEMLAECGVEVDVVEVHDNNDIDREVMRFKPTHVIIEAFWVVPEKFDILKRLHPTVTWMVRSHSKSEFLSLEGIAFTWAIGYLQRGVLIAANSKEGYEDFVELAKSMRLPLGRIVYLPNYYPLDERFYEGREAGKRIDPNRIHIACFGAIRPLKNHMVQALAARSIARSLNSPLAFHVNATRQEGNAEPILKNLRAIFNDGGHDKLVEHDWMDHTDFLKTMYGMDLSLQVSYSETFNIVAADSVACSVPVIGSNQIPWLPTFATVNPNSAPDIARRGLSVFTEWKIVSRARVNLQKHALSEYVRKSKHVWLDWIGCENKH